MTKRSINTQQPKRLEQRVLLRISATPPPAHWGVIYFNHIVSAWLRGQKPDKSQPEKARPVLADTRVPEPEKLTA